MSYVFYYSWSSLICSLILGIILYNDHKMGHKQERQIIFDYALMFHIAYLMTDSVWAMIDGNLIPRTYLSMSIVNFAIYVLTCACTFFWFFYGELMVENRRIQVPYVRFIICIPIFISITVVLIAFCTGHAFYLEENGRMHNPYLYYATILIPIIYIIVMSVHGFRYAFRERNYANRSNVIAVAVYPLILLLSSLFQLFSQRIPILCFGVTITLLYVYITSLDTMISLDPLTQMNNRNQLNRFMMQAEQEHKKDAAEPLSILMMDIDDFKLINDNYGHQEGDRALQIVSTVLRQAVSTFSHTRPFLARYGGDEFLIAIHSEDPVELDYLRNVIGRKLEELSRLNRLEYPLSMSIGISSFDDTEDSVLTCISKADEALYNIKQARKKGR